MKTSTVVTSSVDEPSLVHAQGHEEGNLLALWKQPRPLIEFQVQSIFTYALSKVLETPENATNSGQRVPLEALLL